MKRDFLTIAAVTVMLAVYTAGVFLLGQDRGKNQTFDRMQGYAQEAARHRTLWVETKAKYVRCKFWRDYYRDSVVAANQLLVRYEPDEDVLEGFPLVAYDESGGLVPPIGGEESDN